MNERGILLMKGGNEDDWEERLMNGMERVVSLLRLENSPDVRE